MSWPLTPLRSFVDNAGPAIDAATLNGVQTAINGLYTGNTSVKGMTIDGVGGQAVTSTSGALTTQYGISTATHTIFLGAMQFQVVGGTFTFGFPYWQSSGSSGTLFCTWTPPYVSGGFATITGVTGRIKTGGSSVASISGSTWSGVGSTSSVVLDVSFGTGNTPASAGDYLVGIPSFVSPTLTSDKVVAFQFGAGNIGDRFYGCFVTYTNWIF